LTFNCVICGKLISKPRANQHTCTELKCQQKYHYFLVRKKRKGKGINRNNYKSLKPLK